MVTAEYDYSYKFKQFGLSDNNWTVAVDNKYLQFSYLALKHIIVNKLITTMVIRPLDYPTLCAQSVVADLRALCLGYVGIEDRDELIR